jgi:hypothetical protein
MKTPSSEKNRQQRACYAWHLRPPFRGTFDALHWWKGSGVSGFNRFAAVYELARRHPEIGEVKRTWLHAKWYGQELRCTEPSLRNLAQARIDLGQKPEAVICLSLIGLKPWPRLTTWERNLWMSSARNIEGVDCRQDSECCYILPSSPFDITMWERNLGPDRRIKDLFEGLSPGDKGSQITASLNPAEFTVAQYAVNAFRQGLMLIAVAPDLPKEKARDLLVKTFANEQKNLGKTPGRGTFSAEWLDLIAEFEKDETESNGAKSPIFDRYKTVMDSINFAKGQQNPW